MTSRLRLTRLHAYSGTHWIALYLLLAFTACATEDLPSHPPLQLFGTNASSVAILPLNIALALPPDLSASTKIVSDTLVRVLAAHHKQIDPIDPAQARALWIESTSAVRDSGEAQDFESAVRVLARKLRQTSDFDTLIIPSIYIQNANVRQDGVAKWDGASQKVDFIGQSRWKVEMPPLSTIEAASILLYVFDREGQEIHSKRTGLELIQHLEIRTTKRKGHDRRVWTLTKDSPRIEDSTRISAAIAHAFFPFLPKETP